MKIAEVRIRILVAGQTGQIVVVIVDLTLGLVVQVWVKRINPVNVPRREPVFRSDPGGNPALAERELDLVSGDATAQVEYAGPIVESLRVFDTPFAPRPLCYRVNEIDADLDACVVENGRVAGGIWSCPLG